MQKQRTNTKFKREAKNKNTQVDNIYKLWGNKTDGCIIYMV